MKINDNEVRKKYAKKGEKSQGLRTNQYKGIQKSREKTEE